MGEGPSSLLNQRCRLSPAALWLLCCLLGPTLVPLFPNQTTGPSPSPSQAVGGGVEPSSTCASWTDGCFLDCMTLRCLSPGARVGPRCAWRQGQTFLSFIFNK